MVAREKKNVQGRAKQKLKMWDLSEFRDRFGANSNFNEALQKVVVVKWEGWRVEH